MSDEREPKDKIRARIKPTLDKVAVKGLRAWLKAIGLSSAAYTRPAITDLVATDRLDGSRVDKRESKLQVTPFPGNVSFIGLF